MLILEHVQNGLESAHVSEPIQPGELVYYDEATGEARLCEGADSRVDGVAAGPMHAGWIAAKDDDFRTAYSDFKYYPSGHADADKYDGLRPMPFGGNGDDNRFRARSITDNGTDGAPTFENGDVVGIADSDTNFDGRLVQEGYTDNASTPVTFSRANGNFLPVGRVNINSVDGSLSGFDELVHVVRDKSL